MMKTSADMSAESKFKIRSIPKGALGTLSNTTPCLYTLSIGASDKSYSDLVDAFKWATNRFTKCTVLLGDGLFRITLQIREGHNEETARAKAKIVGDTTLRAFSALMLNQKLDTIRSSELMREPTYGMALDIIEKLYRENITFKKSVNSDAQEYVDRQARRKRLAISQTKAIKLATKYLLEEIAVYFFLAERGWLLDVYFGEELSTLAKIIDGTINDVPEALGKRISISVLPISKKKAKH